MLIIQLLDMRSRRTFGRSIFAVFIAYVTTVATYRIALFVNKWPTTSQSPKAQSFDGDQMNTSPNCI